MSQTIHLPDELYERLAAVAAEEGRPVDAVAESYMLYALRHLAQPPKSAPDEEPDEEYVYDPATDPLAPFIGAFDSGGDDPGWIERHDEYFAATLEPGDRRDDDQ